MYSSQGHTKNVDILTDLDMGIIFMIIDKNHVTIDSKLCFFLEYWFMNMKQIPVLYSVSTTELILSLSWFNEWYIAQPIH